MQNPQLTTFLLQLPIAVVVVGAVSVLFLCCIHLTLATCLTRNTHLMPAADMSAHGHLLVNKMLTPIIASVFPLHSSRDRFTSATFGWLQQALLFQTPMYALWHFWKTACTLSPVLPCRHLLTSWVS